MGKRPGKTRLEEYRKKRDFSKTAEPAGSRRKEGPGGPLRFVIQKHAASHLHYDLRLEMEGVMRSWAVPKGPSLDPSVRRLAMEVEDHPVEYNDFEGTIPRGEYGGGTVMLWDQGDYTPDDTAGGRSAREAAVRAYGEGKLSITFHGQRLRGSFSLVRTETVPGGARSKWLLRKHDDEDAEPGEEITERVLTSIVTGRTMDEIASGKGGQRVWSPDGEQPQPTPRSAREDRPLPDGALLPMLARTGSTPPRGEGWTFEPKYDGIRVLAFVTPGSVALVTRNGLDKAAQFPEVVEGLAGLASHLGRPVVLDGEVVALEGERIVRFERLQGRMHLADGSRSRQLAREQPAAFIGFDILLDGEKVLIHEPWSVRREALERTLEDVEAGTIRLAETSGDQRALLRRAAREGWEGIIAKRIDARYRPGQRTADWVKLKRENRQEFVVGGWTAPRRSRAHLGALLLGHYDAEGKLVYAGHTGTGFDRASLAEVYRLLKRLERKTSPFRELPKTNQPAHWTTPKLVVEVRFNEWTRDGKLRQPVFIGLRDDKDPREVVREPAPADPALADSRESPRAAEVTAAAPLPSEDEMDTPTARKIRQLAERGEGELKLGRGGSIGITSLGKIFYPETGHAKQDLLVYYARMADHVLPAMKDRPLVLKRFPNGVAGEAFYQQAAPDSVPPGVRVETLDIDGKEQRRLVGGNLATLLYTIQLGAISHDPWHSRVQSLESADYTILDLDPGPGASFQRVIEVARWVKEEMDGMGLHGALKTSGSRGLHIYLPLPRSTPLEAATLIAQIIATRVAQAHPKHATVERLTKNRPRGTVYVDYLQNILGKTVAGVYAVRARKAPTVSTPLTWEELDADLDPGAFTIDNVPARVQRLGDPWTAGMSRPNRLEDLRRASS